MPESNGPSVCSAVLPILPSPSARSVPRWRWVWPIALRTCVSFTFAIARHLLCLDRGLLDGSLLDGSLLDQGLRDGLLLDGLLLDGSLVRQYIANRLAARPRNVLGAPQLPERGLGGLQHVDGVRRAERLREHV